MKELNKKEIKELLKKLEKEYGIKDLPKYFLSEFSWFINKEGKVFLVEKNIKNIINSLKNVNKFGLYVFKIEKDGIRFSIEGSQIFGPYVKNKDKIIEVDKEKLFRDEELEIKENKTGYLIAKDKKDFLGSAKIKNNKIQSYIPKDRKIYS